MTAKNFACHLGLAQRKTEDITSRDRRQGFRDLFNRLFIVSRKPLYRLLGVYKSKYPSGPDNEDENRDPCDVLGRTVKYHCDVRSYWSNQF